VKKEYVIDSKGFKSGVGSSKYSQKRRNEIKELEDKIKKLENNNNRNIR
tara:strand:- start:333 stop:479 length:147 start_codon:yes stop_codon:yes gene_type:complete